MAVFRVWYNFVVLRNESSNARNALNGRVWKLRLRERIKAHLPALIVENQLTVSVIVRSYTEARWDDLVHCLESVQNQTTPADEIVLVIDHNPALFERAKTRFPDAVVVENQYDRGSSNAWNMGIETAQKEIVAFIDDDAEAAPDWLEHLLSAYTSPDIVGVGGHIEPVWLNKRPGWFPEEFNWVVGCSYRGLPETIAPVRNLIGCNMSFRRQSLHDINLFLTDKGLGHVSGQPIGCDETELCIRLQQQYPKSILLHNPHAKVYHKVPAARSQWRYFRSRCFLEGKSKATVSRLVGLDAGLASERAYTFKTLPLGVLRGLRDGLFRLDFSGLGRAGAIVAGLSITTMSYVWSTIGTRLRRAKPTST